MVLPQVFKKANFHGWDFEHPCFINKTQNDDTWSADYDVVVDQQLKYDFHYTSAQEGWLADGQCYESKLYAPLMQQAASLMFHEVKPLSPW